jgi:hypothetical protein
MEEYNYRDFVMARELGAFRTFLGGLRAGERAPDGELLDVHDLRTVKLSDLWCRSHLILEFGSFT